MGGGEELSRPLVLLKPALSSNFLASSRWNGHVLCNTGSNSQLEIKGQNHRLSASNWSGPTLNMTNLWSHRDRPALFRVPCIICRVLFVE